MNDGWGIYCEIALIWLSLDFTDGQLTLVQVMTNPVPEPMLPKISVAMASLGHSELIGVITLFLQDIHHLKISFATSVKCGESDQDFIHAILMHTNFLHISYSHFDNMMW